MEHTPCTVSDVMTQTVVAIGQEARFKEIVETMEQWKVSALPVLVGEGRVIGVVSEADLLLKEELREANPDRMEQLRRSDGVRKAGALTAGELMTTPALTVQAGDSLAQAARTMAYKSVKRLPVVDSGGLLQGIVSRSDLLKVFLRSDEDLAAEVRAEVVNRLFSDSAEEMSVSVTDGVVTLSGQIRNKSLLFVAARLVRAVEGVVDVTFDLKGADPERTGPVVGRHFEHP
ncbi:CBS domain-containing protein [Streptomyces sioyaensis]|uniref:CBS domain-containing protein n=1 Tax=Streptomyces sioyaensis TaxID=67364 RepID=A0A4Q1RCH9_9ACTN|nr:CBS domain-containing protein [Streptomyces sioyaensis]MBM4796672.1 CBS domain-containing protein [Streptomyces sioyaensis]RXS71577.1 CBS domain-containing protein [Streptomyces sioyaensis]